MLEDKHAIARHVESQSPDYVDFDLIADNFFGMRAVLRMVPIHELDGSVQDNHIRVVTNERAYAKLPAGTRPPLLVHTDGDVADGRHRWRDAVKRGETEILCYVVEEAPAHVPRPRSEWDLVKYGESFRG